MTIFRTYDDWKLASPDDEPDYNAGPVADCDCCGKHRSVFRTRAFGSETWACDECCGRAEANARLIAAAPDLLDALHRLMSMAEAHATRKREPIAQAYIDADIAVARAAIAKAEGRP